MRIIGKRGDKSLQMIFGLFILLIISLVVLSLFFKFSETSTGRMQESTKSYFSKANIDAAIQECGNLCNGIRDINGIIDFCRSVQEIDFDGDELLISEWSYGQYDFCECFVPCFVLVDDCRQYNGKYCALLLQEKRPDYFTQISNHDPLKSCGLDPEKPTYWKTATGWDAVPVGGSKPECTTEGNQGFRCFPDMGLGCPLAYPTRAQSPEYTGCDQPGQICCKV